MFKLYDFVLSGNCHKIRIMLSMLGLDYKTIPVDLAQQEQLSEPFLTLNPLHKVPVIDDDGLVIRDSTAILAYLALKHRPVLYPQEPAANAEVQQWLSLSVNELFHGLATARALIIFKREGDLAAAQALGRDVLGVLEARLAGHEWLAADRFTIADLACYPYAALSHQGDIDLAPYPATRAWFQRIEALPGYVKMPGLAGA